MPYQTPLTTKSDIDWAFETHVGRKHTGRYKFAILEGNEDAPSKIQFYTQKDPRYNTKPAYIWRDPERRNPKRRGLTVPEKHQLAIARKTLQYSDAGALIMGPPTKAQARAIILRLTGKRAKENPQPKPRAGSRIMKNPKSPLTTKWRPAQVRKTASGDVQVKIPLGRAIKSVKVVASKAKRKVKRVVKRVVKRATRKNPSGSGIPPGIRSEVGMNLWTWGHQYAQRGGSKPSARFAAIRADRPGMPIRSDHKKYFMNGYTAGKRGPVKRNPVKRKATRKATRKAVRKNPWSHPLIRRAKVGKGNKADQVWFWGKQYAAKNGSKPTERWLRLRESYGLSYALKTHFMNGYKAGKR